MCPWLIFVFLNLFLPLDGWVLLVAIFYVFSICIFIRSICIFLLLWTIILGLLSRLRASDLLRSTDSCQSNAHTRFHSRLFLFLFLSFSFSVCECSGRCRVLFWFVLVRFGGVMYRTYVRTYTTTPPPSHHLLVLFMYRLQVYMRYHVPTALLLYAILE